MNSKSFFIFSVIPLIVSIIIFLYSKDYINTKYENMMRKINNVAEDKYNKKICSIDYSPEHNCYICKTHDCVVEYNLNKLDFKLEMDRQCDVNKKLDSKVIEDIFVDEVGMFRYLLMISFIFLILSVIVFMSAGINLIVDFSEKSMME